jgi:hypothetical protein
LAGAVVTAGTAPVVFSAAGLFSPWFGVPAGATAPDSTGAAVSPPVGVLGELGALGATSLPVAGGAVSVDGAGVPVPVPVAGGADVPGSAGALGAGSVGVLGVGSV